MSEKIDLDSQNKKREINVLIQSILNIKRQEIKENINETPEIKLGRRLGQRSYEKLSKEILEHLIIRYEIDNDKLPSRENLINLMIKFLGNIQKTPDYYNLKNGQYDIDLNIFDHKVGEGANGKVYSIKPDELITKKAKKALACKSQIKGIPYNIDIHMSSAALLAFYDFQPKYYNQYFMEIGKYENKSKERTFIRVLSGIIESTQITTKNIKWYILFNFTNIRDQVHNLMIRQINQEFTKIDIRTFNSEYKPYNIKSNLKHIFNNLPIFKLQKKILFNELNKILIINEEFLIDLIIFRTRRGCFNNIDNEDLANQFDCISSSYKVIKFEYNDNFSETYKKYKKTFKNKHYKYNLALSWVLKYFSNSQIMTQIEYNEYINKFNEKAEKFEQIALKIRSEEISITHIINEVIENEKKICHIKRKKEKDKTKEKGIEKKVTKKEESQNEITPKNNIDIKEKNISEDKIMKEAKEESINEDKIMKEIDKNLVENYIGEKEEKNEDLEIIKNAKSTIMEKSKIEIQNENNNEKNNCDFQISLQQKNDEDDIIKINNDEIYLNLNINKENNNKKDKKMINNNFIRNVDNISIDKEKKKEQKKANWFCCGNDSVDVIN